MIFDNLKDSFFRVFDFTNLMHDAIDGGIVYQDVTITRDIETANGIKLVKGDTFHQVNFLFADGGSFNFIDWNKLPDKEDRTVHPKRIIIISQMEMAPFLKW